MAARQLTGNVAYPPFLARPPWWGSDLQTLRNILRGDAPDLADYPSERIEFPAADNSGDRLSGILNHPRRAAANDNDGPLVVLIHGLSGCENSAYMRFSAQHLLDLGYAVLRFNLRGAGPSRPHCRRHYHAGHSFDLRAAFAQLARQWDRSGLVAVGFSLGGNILLKYLGEEGRETPLLAAASVSAPIDLKATQVRMMHWRNRRYHDFILDGMKSEITAPGSEICGRERDVVMAVRSIFEFDDVVVAPRNGFSGADEYYDHGSARHYLAAIGVPTLLIHARNDSWIPAAPYLAFDWRCNPRLTPLLPRGGGHVGFHGLGSATPWHNRCIARFIDGVMAARAVRSPGQSR